MAKQSTAPAPAATPTDDELPQTAVRPRGKDQTIAQLQQQLSEYMEPVEPTSTTTTTLEPTDPEEATFKKRYGDLRRHAQQRENELKGKISEYEKRLTQLESAAKQPMPKTKEEFETWRTSYPDIASFIEMIADEKAAQRSGQLQQELGSVKEKLVETEKEKAYATLKVLVPDIEEIVPSIDYKKWFQNQPMFIQEELNTSDDPHKIAYYMNIYKLTLAPTGKSGKSSSLDALATSVKNTGTQPGRNASQFKFTQSQIAKMSPQEFEKREAEIIEARNSGKILDDLNRQNTVFDI